MREELEDISTKAISISEHVKAKSDLKLYQSLAESNFQDCITSEKLHSWSPTSIEKTKISIGYKGQIPDIEFTVTFQELSEGRGVKCSSQVHRVENSAKRKPTHYSSDVLQYFEDRILLLQREIGSTVLKSSSMIRNMTHYIEWYISRVEMTGKELSILQRRFKGKIYTKNGKDGLHYLELQFRTSGDKQIIGRFEICDSYPFAGLNVTIKGAIDIDALERHLSKNSKPGFGYLSRTCDVFSVFSKS